MKIDQQTLDLGKIIWDYHHMNHTLTQADCIMVLGSHDTRVAHRAADLFMEGFAPYIVFSGGLGRLTEGLWSLPEADTFARIAIERGVPETQILIENRSTNTGENIALSYLLLQKHNIDVGQLILVQKPYMERRTYATFMKQWPGKQVDIRVTSPQLSFEAYPSGEISMEEVLHIMIGDLQRIHVYPQKGFQIYQEIPSAVWNAYLQLIEKGFTHHLIEE